MDDVHIVTIATESKYYFPYLIESCKKHGKDVEILGYGQKWKGFNWRFKLMIEYLETLDANDIVCVVDGYDVICTRNLKELKNAFIKLYNVKKCKIIVGYDNLKHTNFINKFFGRLYFGTCNDISLNAGTYIGYVKDLLYMIKQIRNLNDKNDADDQILLTKYCNLNETSVYIDVDNEIFLTLAHPLNELDDIVDISEDKKLSYNDNFPFFLHGPGSTYLDNVLHKSGYTPSGVKDKIKYKYNIFHVFLNNHPILFTICVLIIIFFLFLILKNIYKKISS